MIMFKCPIYVFILLNSAESDQTSIKMNNNNALLIIFFSIHDNNSLKKG